MATITGYTSARMKEIEDSAIINGVVIGNSLILTRFDGGQINAGDVRGPQGIQGPVGQIEEAPLGTTPYIRRNGLWVPGTEAPIRDTLANLNANNPVVAVGRLVMTIDTVPSRFAIGDGTTAWANLYKWFSRQTPVSASTQAVQSGISTTIVDRTNLTVTFTVGDVPWTVTATEQSVYGTAAGGIPVLHIRDGANVIKDSVRGILASAAIGSTYFGIISSVTELISVPGTYTRKSSVLNAFATGTLTFGEVGYSGRLIARSL